METKRQIIHIGMSGFALLLRWLNWWEALLCATAAIAVNLFVMPRVGKSAFRENDLKRGYALGMVFYSLSVFVMILLLPLPIAAAGWGIMAFGDGMATIVGKNLGNARLPWNSDKSWAGTAGFIIFAAIAASALFLWSQPNIMKSTPLWKPDALLPLINLPRKEVVGLCVGTGILAGILESIPLKIDDNLLVPLASAGIFVVLYHLI